jgi:predicted small lipoprotein YifL
MFRSVMLAVAISALAACGQQGSGPPLPQTEEGALNAPSELNAPSAEGQAMLSAEERAQLEQLVRTYLDEAVRRNGQGANRAAGFNDEVAGLQPGADHRWQINLAAGTAYRILGACDNECSNLDIELIDSRGGVVASDLGPNDFPMVSFSPAANGTYIVRLMMQACTVAPCYAGARVMTTGGGGGQPAANAGKP